MAKTKNLAILGGGGGWFGPRPPSEYAHVKYRSISTTTKLSFAYLNWFIRKDFWISELARSYNKNTFSFISQVSCEHVYFWPKIKEGVFRVTLPYLDFFW